MTAFKWLSVCSIVFDNGYHTTSVDISTLNNLGHQFRNFLFSNNLVDDSARHDKSINDGCAASSCSSNSYYVEEGGGVYSDFSIFNNRFIGSTSRAILVRGGVENFKIYHNSIYGSHPEAYPYALVTFSDAQAVDLRNNIIYGNLASTSQARCVLDEKDTEFSTRNYNLYFQQDQNQPFSGSENGVGGWDTHMSEWDSWRTASGFETASPAPQNPLFKDAVNGDLSLLNSSAAIDAGVIIPGINDNYQGNAPDLGAIESF